MAEKGYVDERIVEMQIDNKKFEDGAKKTIKILEKLEKALNIQSNSNALDNLGDSISKFDASPMADSIEKVSLKMSALEIAGMRVIQNLTDSVYNFATKTVKGLTIDQLGAGWTKYEQLSEAVQTVMAATRGEIGTTWATEEEQMQAINGYLSQLLWYSDETSYSFTDMVDNLGKFLSAGVPLQDAVTAMMGISSWGASAGAKTTEVARVMYNLSQAMGQGKMQLMDWKSIENANMATLEFKKNVLAIAHQKGFLSEVMHLDDETTKGYMALVDPSRLVEGEDGLQYIHNMTEAEVDALITAMNFRESLKDGWFTSDLMTEVFAQYGAFAQMLNEAVNQTGIQATDMLDLLDKYRAIGTENEDKKMDWGKYARAAGMEVEELMAILAELDSLGLEFSENGFRMGQEAKTWNDAVLATKDAVSSGWMRTFQYIFGDFLEAKEFWTEVTGELYDVFAAGGEVRNTILEAWKNFGGRDALLGIPTLLEDGETVVQGALWNLIDAIHSFFDPIHEALAEVFGFATLDQMNETGKSLASFTERVQEFTAKLVLSEEAQESLKTIFKGIFSVIKGGLKIVGFGLSIIAKIISFIKTLFDVLLALPQIAKNAVSGFTNIFTRLWTVIRHGFERGGIEGIIEALKRELPRIFPAIRETLLKVFAMIPSLFPELISKLGGLKNIFSIIFSLLLTGLQNIIPIIFGIIYYAAVGSVEIIKTVFNTIKTKVLPNLVNSFTKTFSRLWTVIRHGFERGGLLGVFNTLKRELSRMFSGSLPKFTKLKKLYDSFIASFKKNYPKLYSNLTKLDLKGRAKNLLTNLGGVRSSVSSFFGTVRSYLSDKALSIANWFGSIDWAGIRAQYPVFDKILTFFSTISDYVSGKWGSLKDWFEGIDWDGLREQYPILDRILTFFSTISDYVSGKWGSLKDWFEGIDWAGLRAQYPVLDKILTFFSTISDYVTNKFSSVKEFIEGINFSNIQEWISSFDFSSISDNLPTLEDLRSVLTEIGNFFSGKISALKEWISSFDFSSISDNLPTLEDLRSVLTEIGNFFSGKISALKEWFSTIDWDAIKEHIPTLEDILSVLRQIGEFFKGKWDGFKEWFSGLDFSQFSGIKFSPLEFLQKILDFLREVLPLLEQGALTLLIASLRNFFSELSDVVSSFGGGKDESFISKASRSILNLAASIGLVALSLKLIASIPAPMLQTVMNSLSDILSMLAIFSASMKIMGGVPKLNRFLSFALSLIVIVFVLKKLADFDIDEFGLGIYRLIDILGMLVSFAVALKSGVGLSSIKGIANLAGGIALLVLAIAGLSILKDAAFITGFVRLIFIMGLVAGFAALMNGISIAGLANIGKVVGSIAGLALIVAGLSLLDPEAFWRAFARLASIMGLIVVFSALMNKFSPVSGDPLGFTGMANGAKNLSDSLTKGGGLTAALSKTLWWLVAIAAITGIVIAGIHDMNEAEREAERSRNEELFGDADATVRQRASSFDELRQKLKETNAEIDEITKEMTTASAEELFGEDGLVAKQEALVKAQQQYEIDVLAAEKDLAQDIAEATGLDYQEVLRQIREAEDITLTEAYKAYEAAVPEEVTVETKPSQEPEIKVTTPDGTNFDVNGMVQNVMSDLQSSMTEVMTGLGGEGGLQESANAFGTQIADTVSTGVENGLASSENPFEGMFPTWLSGMVQTGNIYDSADGVTDWMSAIYGNAVSGLTGDQGFQSNMDYLSQFVPTGLANGVTGYEDMLKNSLGSWYTAGFTGLIGDPTFSNNLDALGLYTDSGIAQGIIDHSSVISGAMNSVANAVTGGFTSGMEIASPSKVMMRLAEYIPMGIAKGIEDNANLPTDSMTILSSAVIAALELAMAQVATVADDNFEFNPMISPVVDLTNVGSAASYMNSALSGSYGVSATMSDAVSRRLSDVERLAASINEGSSQTINGDNITVNVYPSAGQDPEEIADAVISKINTRGIRRGVAFG